MKFKFPLRNIKPDELIKRCGYASWQGHEDKPSYVRRLGRMHYPRFHIYIREFENYFECDMHLDQKQASYEGSHAHSGEHEGPVVENEARRITSVIAGIYGMN
jgi:hypothetical protein